MHYARHDVERPVKCGAMWCKMWCGAMHNVAYIWYLECGVMWYAM